jgi:hypothetical protein
VNRGTCSPRPTGDRGVVRAHSLAGVWPRYAPRSARRSRGSVAVPGSAIARRVASARYAAGSRP